VERLGPSSRPGSAIRQFRISEPQGAYSTERQHRTTLEGRSQTRRNDFLSLLGERARLVGLGLGAPSRCGLCSVLTVATSPKLCRRDPDVTREWCFGDKSD